MQNADGVPKDPSVWRWEFLGTAWSNKSDENPPEGDTKPPGGNNP